MDLVALAVSLLYEMYYVIAKWETFPGGSK